MSKIAIWKQKLPLLSAASAAHFPDKPLVWIVSGRHRDGGLKGRHASCSLYTAAHVSQDRALALAQEENPWLCVTAVRAAGWTALPLTAIAA